MHTRSCISEEGVHDLVDVLEGENDIDGDIPGHCRVDFDVSGFEGSEQRKEGLANGGRSKKLKNRALQHAFEKWLVGQDR